jgi:prepilin-type N-terminal cleavage/methylation domain-containing protein
MRLRTKKSGFSLTELLVAMSVVGVLAGIGLPAVKQVIKSFESSDRVKDVVAAAMSNARARALARNTYTGIRFQRNAAGDQYMIFIEQDENVGPGHAQLQMKPGFRAIQGKNPVRLPRQGAVMDLRIKDDYSLITAYTTDRHVRVLDSGGAIDYELSDESIDKAHELLDAETFSVIFSPQGKLVMSDLRVAHVGVNDVDSGGGDVFDISGCGMFVQDDIAGVEGLQLEPSRNNFVIVDIAKFNAAPVGERYSRCLQYLKPIYVNPYNGELIK